MFELEVLTAARLTDVLVLSSKNRQPDEAPGAKLSFDVALSNDALTMFDGRLKSALFTKAGGATKPDQATLEGVPVVSDAPNLTGIGAHVPVLKWTQELTGYTLTFDLGLGGAKSDLTIGDCKLSNWRLFNKEGGTVNVKFDCESADVSEAAFGKLSGLKSREVKIRLIGPSEHNLDEAGTGDEKWPFPKGSKGKGKVQAIKPTATEAFIATEVP